MLQSEYTLKPHPKYGFLQVAPTPSPEEITKFYADEFYSGDYKRFNDSSLEVQVQDKDFFDGHHEDMCFNIQQILNGRLNGLDVLDIGCGWGQALLYFKSRGMNGYGFDPAPEAVEYACKKGLNVKVAGMDKMNVFEGMKFDVVTMLNVLEHLADPVAVLQEIAEHVLKPGGILAVDVPNEFNPFQVAARELHGLKEWWVAPPAHLNYFSTETLSRTMEGTGFSVALAEASFPLEMFLLFGDNYVKDGTLGRQCHQRRVAFETNLRKLGRQEVLRTFYQSLAKNNLGRQVVVYGILRKQGS